MYTTFVQTVLDTMHIEKTFLEDWAEVPQIQSSILCSTLYFIWKHIKYFISTSYLIPFLRKVLTAIDTLLCILPALFLCINVQIKIHINVYTNIHTNSKPKWYHIYVYICMHIHICVYICIYMYTILMSCLISFLPVYPDNLSFSDAFILFSSTLSYNMNSPATCY